MPIAPDPATRHHVSETQPKSSSVSVRVTGHPPLPSAALTLARASSGVPAYVTADQVSAMVACALTTRDRLLLRTFWESGGRVSEVASLRLCDIDRAEGALQLTNLKQRGPRRHVKLVYISRDLAGALLAFARDTRLGHDGHLFRSRQSGEGHLTRQQVLRIVNRLAVEAGVIVQGRIGPRPACGLDFRHGSAVHLLRSGVPLTEVQSHLGHARVDTTTVYLRLTNRDRRFIADRIDW
ncbi:MAG: site-specific integrase [Actinobacteria bacterium]|nr:site-specific integrase [Actinomycetota bacterium]